MKDQFIEFKEYAEQFARRILENIKDPNKKFSKWQPYCMACYDTGWRSVYVKGNSAAERCSCKLIKHKEDVSRYVEVLKFKNQNDLIECIDKAAKVLNIPEETLDLWIKAKFINKTRLTDLELPELERVYNGLRSKIISLNKLDVLNKVLGLYVDRED